MVRTAFKTDESFLEKISIGAIGTQKVFDDLKRSGHQPLELERGSMNFKIWKEIKIKRLRVPDILCLKCGKRIESRAKTKLEITMSHSSSSPERGWDFGLDNSDYIAFVKCVKQGERPIDWVPSDRIQYASVKSMRQSFSKGEVILLKPKGVTEGFELRVVWPSVVANANGIVEKINSNNLQYKRMNDNRLITVRLSKNKIQLSPLVTIGERITEGQIIIAGVPVSTNFPCSDNIREKYYLQLLNSSSLSERYAAAKALSNFDSKNSEEMLIKKMDDIKEHIYIRLEAAASLLKRGNNEGLTFFDKTLLDEYLENRLECVIILGEIPRKESLALLVKTLLDKEQNTEIRAGAAWSLGELRKKEALQALVKVFGEVDLNIRAEAARALVKMNHQFVRDTIEYFPEGNEDMRAGIAWSLSKSGNFELPDLQKIMVDDEARRWFAWIIGTQDQKNYIGKLEEIKRQDQEVYFAATVLWKVLSSWIDGLDIY